MKYFPVVVLIPIALGDRKTLEHIENQKFDSIEALQNAICFDEDNPMAVEDLSVMTMTDFMDACNDQFINLEEVWVGYVQMKDNLVEVPSEELLGQVVSQIQSETIKMKTYTSKEILEAEDLYQLQDEFSSSGIPFKYQMTEEEYGWAEFIKDKYCISDFVFRNMDSNLVLTFNCPFELNEALKNDGMHSKAVMLSDNTALQRIFFWLAD